MRQPVSLRRVCWLLSLILAPTISMAEEAAPRRYALVVGVKDYPASEKLDELPYAETDATDLAAALKQAGYHQVILMTQAHSHGEGQAGYAPNEKYVQREFDWLVKNPYLAETDCVLVILAGHGIGLVSKTDAKKQTYYFCPADADIDELQFSEEVQPQHNLIPVAGLYDMLKTCKAGVRLLVVDACRNDPSKPPGAFREVKSATRPDVPIPPGGIAALFSCSSNQRAVEDAKLQHGVYSHFLLEALTGKGDKNDDGELTITELHDYAGLKTRDYVKEHYACQQTPELIGEIRGWPAVASVRPPLIADAKAGDLWKKNGLEMKFRWCPPGKFDMTREDEKPPRAETITVARGFWLGEHEVTQAQWRQVMNSAPWQGKLPRRTRYREGDQYPVVYVDYPSAEDFCRKLSQQETDAGRLPSGWHYALPSEAEWEYACRAGSRTAFAFGDNPDELKNYAWYKTTAGDAGEMFAHQVGQKLPNRWNLRDMHGNVAEWCLSETSDKPYRGGSWLYPADNCRSDSRGDYDADSAFNDLGFRVVLRYENP